MPGVPLVTNWILLRKIPFSETSIIASGLSRDYGRVDFFLKGARAVQKRKFPHAELFREFEVQFYEPRSAEGLATIKLQEPVAYHDRIAENPQNYLSACSLSSFLLRNTKQMLPVPQTYNAFSAYLTRMETEKNTSPWQSLVLFTYLYENGFVPVDEECSSQEQNRSRVERLLNIALDSHYSLPPDKNGFWQKFNVWIDNLIHWNGLA